MRTQLFHPLPVWAVMLVFAFGFTLSPGPRTGPAPGLHRAAKVNAAMDLCDPLDPGFQDTDGDGIGDACDLDDDNDGILDTDECASTTFYWSDRPVISGNTATGTINGIAYTYQSSQAVESTPSVYGIGNFPPSYNVPNANPTIKNTRVSNNTLTFAQPMTDPILVFASIGSSSISVGITFGAPVEVLWSRSVVQNTPTQITGVEGYAIVRMTGTFSSISFNYTRDENWVNFVFGASLPSFCDFDGDSIADQFDADSDNDGCPDAIEAGGTDGDGDGVLGMSPVLVDQSGRVTGQGGYTGAIQNVKKATRLVVDTPPANQAVESGGTATFSVSANATSTVAYTGSVPDYTDAGATDVSGTIRYQWQENTGSGFTDIVDGGIYNGAKTATLKLTGAGLAKNGARYRVLMTHPDNACILEQHEAMLTVTGCLVDIGGTVYDDPTGIDDGLGGPAADGTSLGLYVTLVTTGTGTWTTVPVSAAGTFLFSNIPAGAYRLVLGTNVVGSATSQMPAGYFAIGEGRGIVSGSGQSDGTADGMLSFTADCGGIQHATARMAGDVAYTDNNFVISTQASMPVSLVSFLLSREGAHVRLNWNTSSEVNFDHFEIQHSRNGVNWSKLESVQAKGEGSANTVYSYMHNRFGPGVNFYRLKMVDRDGTFSYSGIRSIDMEGGATVVAYPNPSEGPIQLKIPDWKKVRSVQAFDLTGRTVFEAGRPQSEIFVLPDLKKDIRMVRIGYEDGTGATVRIVQH